MFTRLSLRLRIFLFFALLALGGSALVIAGLTIGYIRLGETHALNSFVIAGIVAVFAIGGLTTWVWVLFDEHVARPVERLAADLRARAHADVDQGIDHDIGRYLGDLAPAADAMATNLTQTRNAMAMAVGRETARLATEKARLETLLAEVPDGVLFCTPHHSIALYNGHCRDLLGEAEGLGLGRPVGGLLRMGPILQAYDRLVTKDAVEGTDILVTTRAGAHLLEARLRLLRLEGQETDRPGYVLTLRDVTADLKVQAERAHLLNALLDGVLAALPDLPDSPAKARLAGLAAATAAQKAQTDTDWWPMEALSAPDLGAGLADRLARKGLTISSDLPDTALRCDGFAITRLLERLALDWTGTGATALSLSLASQTPEAAILSLEGTADRPDAAQNWLAAPLSPGMVGFTGADVLLSHGTTLTVEPAGPGSPRPAPEPAARARPRPRSGPRCDV